MKLTYAAFLLNLFFGSNLSLQFPHIFGVGYHHRINSSKLSSSARSASNDGFKGALSGEFEQGVLPDRRPSRFEIVDCKLKNEVECDVGPNECQGDTLYSSTTSHQLRLKWLDKPERVLLLTKFVEDQCDVEVYSKLQEAISFLKSQNLEVVVERGVYGCLVQDDADLKRVGIFDSRQKSSIDLVITFGGDGLLMHCNFLFGTERVPPTMCFDFGSLGFLAPFSYDKFHDEVRSMFYCCSRYLHLTANQLFSWASL